MIVFSRNVIACRCGTDVPDEDPNAGLLASRVKIERGGPDDIEKLDPKHHNGDHKDEMRGRLARGDRLITGKIGDEIVHYFWLSLGGEQTYPSLPGCVFKLNSNTGYGYDAWTHPLYRGAGIRRRSFLKELRLLQKWGKKYEASFFVDYQLDGAIRSLGAAGILVEPLWRITLASDRTLLFTQLLANDDTMRPAPSANGRISPPRS